MSHNRRQNDIGAGMDLGHGFIPRIDARNYKAVERCLTRDGPGLFHEALNLPWAVLEGTWAPSAAIRPPSTVNPLRSVTHQHERVDELRRRVAQRCARGHLDVDALEPQREPVDQRVGALHG